MWCVFIHYLCVSSAHKSWRNFILVFTNCAYTLSICSGSLIVFTISTINQSKWLLPMNSITSLVSIISFFVHDQLIKPYLTFIRTFGIYRCTNNEDEPIQHVTFNILASCQSILLTCSWSAVFPFIWIWRFWHESERFVYSIKQA